MPIFVRVQRHLFINILYRFFFVVVVSDIIALLKLTVNSFFLSVYITKRKQVTIWTISAVVCHIERNSTVSRLQPCTQRPGYIRSIWKWAGDLIEAKERPEPADKTIIHRGLWNGIYWTDDMLMVCLAGRIYTEYLLANSLCPVLRVT